MAEELMLELWHKAGGDIYVYADMIAEKERETCAKIADVWIEAYAHPSKTIADTIRKQE